MSQRAQDAIRSGSTNLMWDVMGDLWCPSTNPGGYVNVGVAENVLMHDHLLAYINTQLTLPAKFLTYNDGGSGSTRLKRAIAKFLNRHLNPVIPLEPSHLLVTNGVSSAIEHVSWAFTDPGEGVLLGKPFYGTFIPDISLRPGTTVIPVNFGACDPFCLEAVDKYEQALLDFQQTGRRVKALMLCHPHNPLGRCYPRGVIIKLMQLCQKYRVHLISDEIYALSVWENTVDKHPEPTKFESALSIDLSGIIDPQLVHVLWGMSKDFGANGFRIGVIISQTNRDLHTALKGTSLYSYASGVSDYLASIILDDTHFTDEYLALNCQKLSESYAYTVEFIRRHGIEYAPGTNAAFFLWVNLGKKYREIHPGETNGDDHDVTDKVMQLLLQKRVFLASGALFGSERSGWFRIVFSQPREYLAEALQRILAALED
ncbi:1-aminocyclopropane-1-carboxylate synthase [Xylona heveae TC161]|uniref:1-aminocyclopropane-1-carboxylate synthase n=1 Tax=Xylona heveae (strain CBS 132557 / TC161) TaxID=1328760 RepID=A0A165GLP2_XYLHT|nr:1-aminocyclopropane-1-carboxylate synthase [Xylona heveae TC161]KZF22346.1 1-aminocyclopropane-1-carboxylate synthase [Xylona heveae TC161]